MDKVWAGEMLRHVRSLAGKEQADAARACGVSRAAVGHWENGRSLPSIPQLHALAGEYGIAPRTLLDLMSIDSHHVAVELREWYRSRPDNSVPNTRDNDAQEPAKRVGVPDSAHANNGSSIEAFLAMAELSLSDNERLEPDDERLEPTAA